MDFEGIVDSLGKAHKICDCKSLINGFSGLDVISFFTLGEIVVLGQVSKSFAKVIGSKYY